jgi:hypothetical protein
VACTQERVGAARAPRGHGPGDGRDLATEVGRVFGGDERSRAFGSLDHHGHAAQRRDDAVARWKAPLARGRAGRQLGDDRVTLGDGTVQRPLAGWIGPIGAAGKHRDRGAADLERPGVGGAVDAERHAADDRHPRRAETPAESARHLQPVGGGPARAHHRDRGRPVVDRAARQLGNALR